MKFQFKMNVKGMKNVAENGVSKVFEGMDLDFEADANVEEIVQLMRDKQIGFDKVINFIKADLPNVIKQSGHALIEVERENRILNNELPRRDVKMLIAENKTLQERIDKMEEALNEKGYQLDSAIRDCRGTNDAYLEEIEKNKNLVNDNEYLTRMNKELKWKLRDYMSEIERDSFCDDLATKIYHDLHNGDKDNEYTIPKK